MGGFVKLLIPTNKVQKEYMKNPKIFDEVLEDYKKTGKIKFPNTGFQETPYYKVNFVLKMILEICFQADFSKQYTKKEKILRCDRFF